MYRKHAKIDAISYDPVNGVSNPFAVVDVYRACDKINDWSCVTDYCECGDAGCPRPDVGDAFGDALNAFEDAFKF